MFRLKRRIPIFEMAFSRSKYQDFIFNLYPQIAQNWSLCKYCQLYRPDLEGSYIHWRSELETCLDNLNSKDTDPKKNKYKWTYQALLGNAELSQPETVFKVCRLKFFNENEEKKGKSSLGITEDQQREVCTLFAKAIWDIIDCIASENMVTKYTRKEFPNTLNT